MRKIFIIAGQSNAWGTGITAPSPYSGSHSGIWFARPGSLRWSTSLTSGSGAGTPDTVASAGDYSGTYGAASFGPELSMGVDLAAAYGDVAVLKFGIDATAIAVWAADQQVGKRFRVRLNHASKSLTVRGQTWEWAGMAWMQGESDVLGGDGTAAAYEANLTTFISEIRALTDADMPFVIGRLSSGQTALDTTRRNTVRAAQADVANDVTGVELVDTDAMGIRADALHFTDAGVIALGQAFAAAL